MGMLSYRFKHVVAALCVFAAFPVLAAPIDDLFDRLADAEGETQGRIEAQIIAEWEKSGSPAMDLLMRRGKDAMADSEPDAALDHFSALIDHAPDFAEGYAARASAYFALGMIGPALDDLRQTLVLNPRHFAAMQGVGAILEGFDEPARALEAYRAVLQLNPQSQDVLDAVARLTLELEGQAL